MRGWRERGTATNGRRVLIIVENLPVPFDRRVWQEAKTLNASGYQVVVICPKARGWTKSEEVIEGITVYRHPLPLEARGLLSYPLEYGMALFWEFVLTWRVYFRHGFDVIHMCNPPDLIFLVSAIFKYCLGKKVIFDHHDINPELFEAKFQRKNLFYHLTVWFERLTFAVADVSIATNESYRDIAIRRGGMAEDRVFIVRSGPNLERIKPVEPDDRYKRGRRLLVGYVGVIGQQEGIQYLLKAAQRIVEVCGRTDVQFIIVGSGPELSAMRSLAKSIGVDDYVEFAGHVSDGELLTILSTADVCVNPDEVNDMNDKSTMNKIMEYMAIGKPIVQFEMTEGRFSAAEASLYAAPNDAQDFATKIMELLDDAPGRRRMGEIGQERVKSRLAWRHQEAQLLAAYGRALRS